MNTIKKIILGASLLSMPYLNSCVHIDNKTVDDKASVQVYTDSTRKTVASLGNIQLESNEITWTNTKLISKDEGFISYLLDPAQYSDLGMQYVFAKCLFKNPNGDEVSLFSKDGTFYVGQNYDIQFYLLKPNQKISSGMILDALESLPGETTGKFQVKQNKYVDDLDGILNKYSRVKK